MVCLRWDVPLQLINQGTCRCVWGVSRLEKIRNKIKKEPESHKQTASVLSKEAFPDHRGGGKPTKGENVSHVRERSSWCVRSVHLFPREFSVWAGGRSWRTPTCCSTFPWTRWFHSEGKPGGGVWRLLTETNLSTAGRGRQISHSYTSIHKSVQINLILHWKNDLYCQLFRPLKLHFKVCDVIWRVTDWIGVSRYPGVAISGVTSQLISCQRFT